MALPSLTASLQSSGLPFTETVAEEVRSSGVQKALEPMGSADRKIVHDTVNALDGVSTISEGDEPRRRVVIIPS